MSEARSGSARDRKIQLRRLKKRCLHRFSSESELCEADAGRTLGTPWGPFSRPHLATLSGRPPELAARTHPTNGVATTRTNGPTRRSAGNAKCRGNTSNPGNVRGELPALRAILGDTPERLQRGSRGCGGRQTSTPNKRLVFANLRTEVHTCNFALATSRHVSSAKSMQIWPCEPYAPRG